MQIKRQNTIRERLELSRFLAVVEQDIVKNWSAERAPGRDGDEPKIPVQDVPKRDLKLWTEAYQWASSPRESLKAGNLIYVASSTLDKELATAIRDVEEKNQSASWADFDDFAACRMPSGRSQLTQTLTSSGATAQDFSRATFASTLWDVKSDSKYLKLYPKRR